MLPRDDEEATGAILVLDRECLRVRYKLVQFQDPIYDGDPLWGGPINREAEELIGVPTIVDLKNYMIDVIWLKNSQKDNGGRYLDEPI